MVLVKCAGVGAAKFSKSTHVRCGSVRSKKLLSAECAGVPKLAAYKYSALYHILFVSDDSVEVLDAMITNMVHVIDALARFGVLQFGQGGQFSADLSAALLHCEATVDRTRNWRLQVEILNELQALHNA